MVDTVLYSLTWRKMTELSSLSPTLSRVPYPPGEPKGWLPLYTMITFRPDISYATARRKARRQAGILDGVGWVGAAVIGVAGVWAASALRQTLIQRLHHVQ
jgi:kynurenine 3-monooxygenase